MKTIRIKNIVLGYKKPLVLVAGPCVIESRSSCLNIAKKLKALTERLEIPFIFKASYDKANRSSLRSYRGPGLKKGLEILSEIRNSLNVPILSDVHLPDDIEAVKETLDVIQIPAFLCRQTDLILEAARTGKPINVKKGQFLAPWDVKNIAEKILSTGNKNIIFTERGTSFGYNNLVSDMRAIVIMKKLGYPVFYDATHSVQLPGGRGTSSGGECEMASPLAKAAVAAGCDGLFLEVHEHPEKALSDSATMLSFKMLLPLLKQVKQIHNITTS
ncbi:MAG: 3-deoxy-8-phosphooctulonate synthase [Planctomycetes bacterium]|nr:3-deoxy-8-phosphooctulonate synthase [Planctomycetota bacterium]